MSHSIIIGYFKEESDDATNSVIALKDNG